MKDFKISFFCDSYFRFMNYGNLEEVMIRLKGEDESSLSDTTVNLIIRTDIGQFHSS